jgi:hypothetical protein
VTPGLVALAALLAWGPVAPPPEAPAPASQTVEPAAVQETPPAAVAPATPPPVATPIITKAPIDVRAQPVLVASPAAQHEPSKPLLRQWGFWAIAGGFLAATITLTILATRPAPNAYRGNAPPYYMPFP